MYKILSCLLCLGGLFGACSNPEPTPKNTGSLSALAYIKAQPPEAVRYHLSMPIYKVEQGQRLWGYYLLLLQDSTLEAIAATADSALVEDLVVLLEEKQHAWQANVMLYALTGENALRMEGYAPNKYWLWLAQQHATALKNWKRYLAGKK
jgi:hypothetical protein